MTITDICNMALSYISKGSILSLDDGSEEATQCKIHYDSCRSLMLRTYTWGFARRVVKLAALDESLPEWRFVYAYPAKCCAVRLIYNEDTAADKYTAQKASWDAVIVSDNTRAIATNVEEAWAEYTRDVTNTDVFPPEFVQALAHFLASQIALPLTGSGAIMETQYQMFQAFLLTAKKQDAQERNMPPDEKTPYQMARFS